MELRQIKYFIEVAKREHVTEAANHLHVAQSAISRQISNLEAELNVKLFTREGRNVKLTSVGELFLEHAEIAMNELENGKQKIAEFLNPESGLIRIGFPNSLAAKTLPAVISAFRDEHPNLGFKLRQGSLNELKNQVSRGHIDLAFVSPVPMNEEDIIGHICFTEKLAGLVPIHHPIANRERIRLRELQNEPFVIFSNGFELRNIVQDACKQVRYSPTIAFEGEDIDTIKGLVGAGLGVSLLPEVSLSDHIPRETKKVLIDEPQITRTVGVIIPRYRELAPSEQLFFHFVKEFYAVLNRFGQ
jgi:LysR family transcriptional regulator, transcription activator of glutamate synthase operon